MQKRVMIRGRVLGEIRRERYLTQEEFAQRLEMSPANVRRIEQSDVSGIQVKNFRRLASLLNLAPAELRERIGAPADAPPAAEGATNPSPPDAAFPSTLLPATRKDVVDVRHYHGVSAARIEDRSDASRGAAPAPAGAARRFAVTVDGDCMEPRYADGDVVIFSVDAAEREGIIDGKNYFVQFTDGENTFKRVFLDPENRELLTLRCWNPKYPPRIVERSTVRLLARAVYKLTPDE